MYKIHPRKANRMNPIDLAILHLLRATDYVDLKQPERAKVDIQIARLYLRSAKDGVKEVDEVNFYEETPTLF